MRTEQLREALLADYVAAEDALRAFTDQNFGRMCAICARWTLLAARTNAAGAAPGDPSAPSASAVGAAAGRRGVPASEPVTWRLSSVVTNCCNANHALESMSDATLAGIVASREEGQAWWRRVKRAHAAPCAALTDSGCALQRGRPELCNKYFCEAVRDYLWSLGGETVGPSLAARLDELQRRWAKLYSTYQRALLDLDEAAAEDDDGVTGPSRRRWGGGRPPAASRLSRTLGSPQGGARDISGRPANRVRDWSRRSARRAAGWDDFFPCLGEFDRLIALHARPVSAADLAQRLFRVEGERALYEPFFAREVAAISGEVRRPTGTRADEQPAASTRG